MIVLALAENAINVRQEDAFQNAKKKIVKYAEVVNVLADATQITAMVVFKD